MEVIFLKSFLIDIKKIQDKKLKAKIKDFIIALENTDSLEEINKIKKLKGFTSAYRWKSGDFRLGFYKDENKIELARFVKRNDVYKVFP